MSEVEYTRFEDLKNGECFSLLKHPEWVYIKGDSLNEDGEGIAIDIEDGEVTSIPLNMKLIKVHVEFKKWKSTNQTSKNRDC